MCIFTFSCRECQVKDWSTHRMVCHRLQTCDSEKSNIYNTESASNASCKVSLGKSTEPAPVETHDQISSSAQPTQCVFGNRKQLSYSTTDDTVTRLYHRVAYNSHASSVNVNKNYNHSMCPCVSKTSQTHVVDKKFDSEKTKTCGDLPELDTRRPSLCIRVKANKKKYEITLQSDWSGATMMGVISHNIRIPLDRLKLIRQGKHVTAETITQVATNKAVFQAIGEEAENEEGLEDAEIKIVMKQAEASRNQAVRSLRKTGDVIDAIFDITNK